MRGAIRQVYEYLQHNSGRGRMLHAHNIERRIMDEDHTHLLFLLWYCLWGLQGRAIRKQKPSTKNPLTKERLKGFPTPRPHYIHLLPETVLNRNISPHVRKDVYAYA